ncbi:hypothetical protein [Roseibium sp.]|uniref:hypothetical protein n=1 Tax=Roseibium sp. TaxID=1936156 RepID=UPI003B52BE4C
MDDFLSAEDDIFGRIAEEIVKNKADLSRLYHAETLGKEGFKNRVSDMSEQELLTLISTRAQQKLKAHGDKMNAVQFFKAVTRCARIVRQEAT